MVTDELLLSINSNVLPSVDLTWSARMPFFVFGPAFWPFAGVAEYYKFKYSNVITMTKSQQSVVKSCVISYSYILFYAFGSR